MSRVGRAFAVVLVLTGCVRTPPSPGNDASAGDAATSRAGASSAEAGDGALTGRFGQPEAKDPAAKAERGRVLYARYCNFCHGEKGLGYKADEAPALANDDLLTIASDAFLEHAILKGRPGTTMSAWSVARGGPLSTEDASALVAYLRTWQTRPSEIRGDAAAAGSSLLTADAAPAFDPASAARGAPLYAAKCARCHGARGEGARYNAIANPELLASATDELLAATIERGRSGTPMPSFRDALSRAQIGDLVMLLRSWQKAPDESAELPPRPGALERVVLNPRGPEPAFDAKADFIGVDIVKRELDRRATMVIIDARPPSDYARMHVAGAISVPFYEVEAYAAQIPKERFILTYCACPHGSSVKGRDALRAIGYKRVAVLDEGILPWRDRGYPVRGGKRP